MPLREGTAFGRNVETAVPGGGDRFIYLIYGYGNQGAVADGRRGRQGRAKDPTPTYVGVARERG